MKHRHWGLYFALAFTCWAVDSPTERANDIVRRSVANMNADWAAAPQYDFTERDSINRNGKHTVKTYQVMMVEGSPYNKLIALENQPLPAAQAAAEDRKAQGCQRSRREAEDAPEDGRASLIS